MTDYTRTQQRMLKMLGTRVCNHRERKGWSLQKLADIIGKDPQSIHRLEKGNVNPSYLYLSEIAKGLNLSIGQLVEGLY